MMGDMGGQKRNSLADGRPDGPCRCRQHVTVRRHYPGPEPHAARTPIAILAIVLAIVAAVACTPVGRQPHSAPPAPNPTPAPPSTATPTAAQPPAVPTSTAAPIPSELRQEIEDAYDRFWRVRADASLRLDPSRLPEVAAGQALERERQEIARLQAEGKAARIVVDLRFRVVQATNSTATIQDDFENRSYLVDAVTKQPIGPLPTGADIVKVSFDLQKIDGAWRVVDGTRYAS